jgi:hypothetical protein
LADDFEARFQARRAAWQRERTQGAALIAMLMFGYIALLAACQAPDLLANRRSRPFLLAPAFQHIPGCPEAARTGDVLTRRCLDPRYLIRWGPAQYGLPQPSRGRVSWIRIGDAAASLDCNWFWTLRRDATRHVAVVRRGVFPMRSGAPLR